jgi:hypothetical protein
LKEQDPLRRERWRSQVSGAMARFHAPQLMRLHDTFRRIGAGMGDEAAWS